MPRPAAWRTAPSEIHAPSTLSIVDTPNETLAFLNDLATAKKSGPVTARLDAVTKITHDAIVALMAIEPARGHLPILPDVQAQLLSSGVQKFIKVKGLAPLDSKGHIVRKPFLGGRVQPAVASGIVSQVRSSLGGAAPGRSIYSMLIECMGNTDNHAQDSSSSDPATWWVSMNRLDMGSVAVTFLDMGVGILNTTTRKGWFHNRFEPSGKRLADVLYGRVGSSTRRKHRGKGLPEITRKSLRDHQISRLVVVSNDGYFDVVANKRKTLKHPLSGTLLYWEINGQNTPSLP